MSTPIDAMTSSEGARGILQPSLAARPLCLDGVLALLIRNHSYHPQPSLHQLRPCRDRQVGSSQPECVPALSVQMHLYGTPASFNTM